MSGEIRNIQVLGVLSCGAEVSDTKSVSFKGTDKVPDMVRLSTRLVIAYQGQGSIKAFVGTAHSLELREVGNGNGSEKYHKYGGGRNFRYAEYEVPPLPTTIFVTGCTDADPALKKPVREAHVRAKISSSGQVEKCQHQLHS